MINPVFREVARKPADRFAGSPLGKSVEGRTFDKPLSEYDKPLELGNREIKDSPNGRNDNMIAPKNELKKLPADGGDNTPGLENDEMKNCPINNGNWDGARGNSKWVPDPGYTPGKANPESGTWGEILDEYGIDGIDFKDGEPDFGEISKGKVEIDEFSANRTDNFDKADIALAEQRGCTPGEVAEWRKENGYTWHECKDMQTLQKVPSKVHNNIPHSGGISEAKKGNGDAI